MLRGGSTLDIGWAVMFLVPFIMGVFLLFVKRASGKGDSNGPYVDGKPTKRSNIILGAFLILVAVMVLLAAIFTPVQ